MHIEKASQLPKFTRTKLPSLRDQAYYINGDRTIGDQYGCYSPFDYLELMEKTPAVSDVLQYSTQPIPNEISTECTNILKAAQILLPTPECVKHVYSVFYTEVHTPGKTTKIYSAGINGWHSFLVTGSYYFQDSIAKLEIELKRLGSDIDHDSLIFKAMKVMSSKHRNTLSCSDIHQVLTELGVQSDMYCRKGLHIADPALRLPNKDNCPSTDFCAEGAAAYLKPFATFLAMLLDTDTITVFGMESFDRNHFVINYFPTDIQSASVSSRRPSRLIMPNMYLDLTGANITNLLTSDLSSLAIPAYSEATITFDYKHHSVHPMGVIKISSIQESELTFELRKDVQQEISVDSSIIVSSYPPCVMCAYDAVGRFNNTPQEGRPSALFFERFSRHDERVDAGDIIPLAFTLDSEIRSIRFGKDLPFPQLKN